MAQVYFGNLVLGTSEGDIAAFVRVIYFFARALLCLPPAARAPPTRFQFAPIAF